MRKVIIGIVSRAIHSNSDRNMLGVYESYIRSVIKGGGIPLIISPTQNIEYELFNKHVELNDEEIDNNTLLHIMDVARLLKKRLEEKFNIDGLTLIQNNGDIQEVKHFHLHLKPYYNNKKDIKIEEVYNILKGN